MAYLGNPPAEAYTNTVKDSFNGDGSTTAFTLSQPSTTNNLRVVVENVIQDPTVAYSCSGTTLTFTSAPPSGTANIYAVHLGPAVMTAVPPTEITNATTYTSALTVQGAFTSPGIDDNATSTAMTLDSSGNLVVGKNAIGIATVGGELRADGQVTGTRDGGVALALNRKTSDGDIAVFQKDGTTKGSIGTAASGTTNEFGITSNTGQLILGTSSTTNRVELDNAQLYPAPDATMNLGASSLRWADLYLSGGVYLGGTGSANKISDYEQGSWTPTIDAETTSPTVTYVDRTGRYTKVGNMVTLYADIQPTITGGSGGALITGLPFTVTSADIRPVGGMEGRNIVLNSGYTFFYLFSFANNNQLYIRQNGSNKTETTVPIGNIGTRIGFSFTYMTDS